MKFRQWLPIMAVAVMPYTAVAQPSAGQTLLNEKEAVGTTAFTASGYKPGLLRHIVLFKYLDTVTEQQREEVKRRFLALQTGARRENRPYIASIETGHQTSGEGADRGLDQAFIVTFCSEGDRNYYVGTPVVTDQNHYEAAHAAFKQFVAPYLSDVVVFDYTLAGGICRKRLRVEHR
jgi:hypothetical protein